jgi:hypothetical protein
MPRKKDTRNFLYEAKRKDLDQCMQGINDAPVHNKATDKILREYQCMMDLWNL